MNRATTKQKRLASVALLALLAIALTATQSRAETNADLRAGVYTDAGAFGLGGGVLTSIGTTSSWYFNPNLEAAFADRRNVVTLNADFHYDVPTTSSWSMYMGGGPAVLMRHSDGGGTRSDAGVNLIGGAAGTQSSVRPFMQLKGTLSNNSELAFMGGVRF